jgi:hypothetical protein
LKALSVQPDAVIVPPKMPATVVGESEPANEQPKPEPVRTPASVIEGGPVGGPTG